MKQLHIKNLVLLIFFSSFFFLLIVSLQPHSPLTQRVLPEIFMPFSWFRFLWLPQLFGKNIFYCWVFFICLPYFMPPPSQSQIALDWFCCSNWKLVSSSFPCWTLTWLLSSSPEKQVAYQGPVPQKRYSSSPLAGELSWPQPQLRSSEKSDQCGYTGSSLWTWSITGSLGLVVDKQLGQGQGRKHERSPTGNSVGTPSILANRIPRFGLGLLSICFTWWKFLTKT